MLSYQYVTSKLTKFLFSQMQINGEKTGCLILLPNFLAFSCETQGKFDVASDVIKT